jgi:hypothetical protein
MKLILLGALVLILVSGGRGQPKTSSGPANSPAVAVSNHLAAIAAAGEPVTLDQLSRIYEEPGTDTGRRPKRREMTFAETPDGLGVVAPHATVFPRDEFPGIGEILNGPFRHIEPLGNLLLGQVGLNVRSLLPQHRGFTDSAAIVE